MEEWREYRLEEIGTVVGGATPSTKDPTNYDGDISWITPKDLSGYESMYIDRGERMITQKGYDSCSCKMLPKGSVLFSSRAPIGYVAIAANELCTNQGFKSVVPNDKIVNNIFLYYLLAYKKDFIEGQGSGTTFKEVSGQTMKNVVVKLPSLSIQERIASILKSLDDKIEVNRRINENLEQQAQALFKSWLNNCDDEVTIGDLSINITDYTKCEQKQVVLINSSDVTEGRFEHHNLSENKNLKGHFKKRFQKGDILYSQVRPRNRHWGYCTFNADNYLASTQLMVIRNRPDIISSILLYQYIIEDNVWMDFTLRTETRSGTFPQGNYEDLSSIKIPFGADIEGISKNLESIYSLIYNNERESRRLASLRDTLLPKLMSGELKINEVEI